MKVEWDDKLLLARVSDIVDTVAKNGAERIAKDAKNILQSKQKKGTGELAKSIKVKKSKFNGGGYMVVMGGGVAWYGLFIGLGTPGTTFKAGRKKGSKRTPIKAKPFMRPALEKNKSRISNDFKEALK